ncbi:MAG: beta-lactamase family protein [Sphingomonadaceae bacterium]|uniref:serine hydrolase domain-containing protein n=1 Tax=Thermaurantiacus sp. TaxID=2820283 RepID=UPI00298EDE91|nr:serine hydrolase domain-containing protein [Thermaurantiacus sp.]MCS6987708.1 beta-lactamase family protein [Sphingomonadaceae bacterium]MDW8415073.1 serine hydrolase domain-containing protein [Thermaurantiacus sp.]
MPHGFRPHRLEAIDRFLNDRYVVPGRLPGTLLLVARGGEVVHRSVLGHADLAAGRPLAEDTIFRIYSMTKPITSVAFMMLVEEGRIALDDPVDRHIPEWTDLGVYVGGTLKTGFLTRPPDRPMQVIDLLRHTAGLTYGFQLRSNVDAAYRRAGIGEIGSTVPLADMVRTLAGIPLEFSPGTAWCYSVATDVLGFLIERLSGRPLDAFLSDRIFRPLGMVDTGFFVPEAAAHRLATCYQARAGGGLDVQDPAETSPFLQPPRFLSGGGGLVGTAADYLRFVEALRTGQGDLVGRRTFAQMTANHLPGGADLPGLSRALFSEASYAGVGFGLGLATTIDWVRTGLPGHNGDWFWGGAASTFFWCDPTEELSVVFMTQLMPSSTWPIRRELRQLVYAALA